MSAQTLFPPVGAPMANNPSPPAYAPANAKTVDPRLPGQVSDNARGQSFERQQTPMGYTASPQPQMLSESSVKSVLNKSHSRSLAATTNHVYHELNNRFFIGMVWRILGMFCTVFITTTLYLLIVKETGGAATRDVSSMFVRAVLNGLVFSAAIAWPGRYLHLNLASSLANGLLDAVLGHLARMSLSRRSQADQMRIRKAYPQLYGPANIGVYAFIEALAFAGLALLAAWTAILFADWNNSLLPQLFDSTNEPRQFVGIREWGTVKAEHIILITILTTIVAAVPMYSYYETHTSLFMHYFNANQQTSDDPHKGPVAGYGQTAIRRGYFGKLGLFGTGNDQNVLHKAGAQFLTVALATFILHPFAYTNFDLAYHFGRWVHDPASVSDTWPIVLAIAVSQLLLYPIIVYLSVSSMQPLQRAHQAIAEDAHQQIEELSASQLSQTQRSRAASISMSRGKMD